MQDHPSKTLYVFLDESGNFDFSSRGTKFFILTGFATFDPVVKREDLVSLRYDLLRRGIDQEFFHASEDPQHVRNDVFGFLPLLGQTFEIHSIVAQKNKTHPNLYTERYEKKGRCIERVTGMGLYRQCCESLLRYLFHGKQGHVDKIVIILGSLYTGDKQRTVQQTIRHFLKVQFPSVQFEIFSHPSCADLNCQLADYCCWAIAIKYERAEERPYRVIASRIKNLFEIFKGGDREFYSYTVK